MNLSVFSLGLAQFIPVIVFILSVGTIALLLTYREWRAKRIAKSNPLTADLLRPPGYSLSVKIDDLTGDLLSYIGILGALPLLVYGMALSRIVIGDTLSLPDCVFYIVIGSTVVIWGLSKISKTLTERAKLRLGLDAEMFVGQELNHLMREGCYVYHDFPADKFNIDHIVIGPTGIFAIETKGRSKPSKGNDSQNNREVIYDGKYLKFPGWTEAKPLEQATIQAKWLQDWITKAIGEPVKVRPVLAIPGWFIKRTEPNGIPVINGKNCTAFFLSSKVGLMDDTLVKRIAFSIEQRCRDVKPLAHQPAK
jgi:hypothetical protein